jgi:microcin C transport system substrate-binding protein
MNYLSTLPKLALILALVGGLSGCGKRQSGLGEANDITPELEAHYASFKRVPPEWQTALRSGEITQEELNRRLTEVPLFFQFAALADLPTDLVWDNGQHLPDIGSPAAIKGGTLYTALQDFPRTLRHVGPDSNGSFRPYILDDVLMGLAKRHPNETGIGPNGHHYVPGLAREWALDRDSKTVFVRLDPDARWSDGEPLTADDFLFMFFFFQSTYIRAPWYNNYYTEMYTKITRYDAHTLSVTTNDLKPDILSRVLELRPVPKHFFRELGDDYVDRYQWRFQPTTGAYVIRDADIRKGQSIALTRLEDWWAKDKKFWRNRFNFDRIHFSVIRDVPKTWEAFRRGDIDGSGLVNLPEYWYDKLPDSDPDVQSGYIFKAQFYNEVPRPTYGLWINQAKPLLDNRDIRVGIQYATNFERVIAEYFRNDYTRMRTTSDGYGEFSHPTLTARPYDVTKALEAFAKAGFVRRGNDGVLVNDRGQRLSFTLSTGYPHFQDLLTILREEAMKAGLEFRLEVLDGTAGWKKVQEKNHEITFSAFNVSPEMYPRFWETYHSANAYDEAFLADGVTPNPDRKIKTQTNNLQSIADPELDALIMRYRRSSDAGEMKRLAFRMEEMLYDDASFVPGFVQPFYRAAYWRYIRYPDDFNVKLSRAAGEYFLAWIDPEEKARTQAARRSGEKFEPSVRVFDQYREVIATPSEELSLVYPAP